MPDDRPPHVPQLDHTCHVLRCTAERQHVIDIAPTGGDRGFPHHVALCDEHHLMIDAGEEYYAPSGGQVVYVGRDLADLGLKRVTGGSMKISGDRLGSVDDHLRTLTVQYETVGDEGKTGEIILLLTPESRRMLGLRPQG